jgi:hypothetical protein
VIIKTWEVRVLPWRWLGARRLVDSHQDAWPDYAGADSAPSLDGAGWCKVRPTLINELDALPERGAFVLEGVH